MHKSSDIRIKNKRASFDYEFIDKYVAGIELFGTEIKSIRLGKASLVDTFCIFEQNELWVKNMSISGYAFGSYTNHQERRDRKLLLTKKELRKLQRETKETGYTIIPISLFINDKGLAKMEIALARGKKQYDKRETIKNRDLDRELARDFRKGLQA